MAWEIAGWVLTGWVWVVVLAFGYSSIRDELRRRKGGLSMWTPGRGSASGTWTKTRTKDRT